MKRFLRFAVIATVLTMAVTSCGKDEENELSTDTGTLMPIPVTIVDGVRITSVKTGNTDFSKIDYNSDGSVASASINGVKYAFEYASTRASEVQYTDSKLIGIVSRSEEGEVCKGSGFAFDKNTGFVTQWIEALEYKEGPYYYKSTKTFTPIYNSEGRIAELKLIGKAEWNDPDEGKDSASGSFVIQYHYSSGNLVSCSFEDPEDGTSEYRLVYNGGPANMYNIAPYPLSYVMGHGEGSVLAGCLAQMGYLGIPSAFLPTSISYCYDDEVDSTINLSYHTNSIGQVTSMDYWLYEGVRPTTFEFSYTK